MGYGRSGNGTFHRHDGPSIWCVVCVYDSTIDRWSVDGYKFAEVVLINLLVYFIHLEPNIAKLVVWQKLPLNVYCFVFAECMWCNWWMLRPRRISFQRDSDSISMGTYVQSCDVIPQIQRTIYVLAFMQSKNENEKQNHRCSLALCVSLSIYLPLFTSHLHCQRLDSPSSGISSIFYLTSSATDIYHYRWDDRRKRKRKKKRPAKWERGKKKTAHFQQLKFLRKWMNCE